MKQQWRVHRNIEVTSYLVGLRYDGVAIRAAIESLKENGIPPNATLTQEPNTYLWLAAEHWIVAVKEENNQAIYVTAIARSDD